MSVPKLADIQASGGESEKLCFNLTDFYLEVNVSFMAEGFGLSQVPIIHQQCNLFV